MAAQLRFKADKHGFGRSKPIWVDVRSLQMDPEYIFLWSPTEVIQIGGGTGYNIEAMHAYLDVPTFFSNVYLVDLSPSLCEVARKRFDRLGWKNVAVVCQDARAFRLQDQELSQPDERAVTRPWNDTYDLRSSSATGLADLITMSYSLSMIPGSDQCHRLR